MLLPRITRAPLKIQEEDGSPSGFPRTLKFANGNVTDNGDGTFSIAGGGGLSFASATSDPSPAVAGTIYNCDVSGGSFTITLNATPTTDDRIGFLLSTASGTNTVTIDGNGKTINGNHDSKLYVARDYLELQYDGSAWQTVVDALRPHSCCLSRDTSQTLVDSTNELIEHDNEDYDIGGIGATGASAGVTTRRAGRYLVSIYMLLANVDDGEFHDHMIYLNAARHRFARAWGPAAGSNQNQPYSQIMDLAASDLVQQYCFHNKGSNLSTNTSADLKPILRVHELRDVD